MSELIQEQPLKQTTVIERVFNSNILTTTLTCSILMVIFAVCFRPSYEGAGGGGYDPSADLLKRLAEMQNRIDALSKALQDEEWKYVKGKPSSTCEEVEREEIFFNAKLTDHTTITPGHTVIFNKVIDNSGNGYNGLTGIFRAPSRGKYLFSLSILSISIKAKYVHTLLVKTGNEIGRVFAGSDAANWGQMGSVTIVAHLEKGDEVYAKQMHGVTGDLHGDLYCSFSGVKI